MLSVALTKQLRDFELNVAFDVASSDCHVLIGPTGCGKTMTLRAIAGLERPDAGRVVLGDGPDAVTWFDSATGVNLPPERRRVGLVFQDYALFPHMSVLDNVAYGLRARGERRHAARSSAQDVLERVQLSHLARERPTRLSGGQQQRVAVARAVASGAQLLLFDEPMSALDTQMRRQVRDELKSIVDGLGVTAVVVTHDPVDALTLGDVISVVQEGRICQTGTRQELLARPRNDFVASFLGVNLLTGEARAGEAGLTEIRCGSHRFYSTRPASGPVFLTCHPAAVSLSRERPHGSALNVASGAIGSVSHLGAATRVEVLLEGANGHAGEASLVAEVSHLSEHDLHLHKGQPVYAAFKAAATEVYPRG